jgi:hypothetical protein
MRLSNVTSRSIGVIAFSCFFVVSVANAQATVLNEFHIGCRGLKTLPFAQEKSTVKDLEPLYIEGYEVRVKSHKLEVEQIVFLESCEPQEKPVVEDSYWGRLAGVARDFATYEIKGNVLAYRFSYYVVMTKNRQITTWAGAMGDIYYVDEDGNGSFERYLGKMPLQFLPDWIKTAKPQPIKSVGASQCLDERFNELCSF